MFQLLNEKLEVIKEAKTQKAILEYTDTLPNMGRGLFIYSKRAGKSIQLV
jgi:hypothetical protein